MDGHERIPDPGDGWRPTKREVPRQREAEEIRQHARAMAAPVPPLSQETLQRVAAIVSRPTPNHELMEWRRGLFCGHVVKRAAHASHTTVHGAFTGSTRCPECGLDPATIVAAEAGGLVEERPPQRKATNPEAEQARIEKAIARHERELERLRAELRSATRAE
jgi:hypothetical protein